MNREQKAVAIEEIAGKIDESDAIFAVDFRGITVEQVAELRTKLRPADATFKVVKNSLTERAADQAGAESLKDYLSGPTALTFVRGDVATAAKVVADYGKATQLLPFKGGLMEGAQLDVEQIRSLSRLPSREVLYGQLVGVVASPIGGLVRSLGGLLGGLAVALGQVREKKESGEIPAGAAPEAAAPAAAEEPAAEAAPEPEEPKVEAETAPEPEAPKAEAEAAPESQESTAAEAEPAEEPAAAAEPETEAAPQDQAESAEDQPAQGDDNKADVSAEAESKDAETNPTKED
jgi:large subunit ribosomal protein L10